MYLYLLNLKMPLTTPLIALQQFINYTIINSPNSGCFNLISDIQHGIHPLFMQIFWHLSRFLV